MLAAASMLVLSAACVAALGAQAVPSDGHFRGFEPNADLMPSIGGVDQPAAEIFFSQGARSYLLISSELPSPVLINAATQSVETVDLTKVSRQLNGSVDLLADAAMVPAGKFELAKDELAFQVAGKAIRLKQRPWQLGKKKGPELLQANPSYRFIARNFNPDAGIVKRLKAGKEPVRVLTFFGSWCPHCKKHLPLLMKVEEALAGSKFQFEYYGLPSPFGSDAEAKKYGIASVPTAILFVGDKEIGRIPSSQWSNPEVAIDLQLNGPGRSASR